MSKKVTVVIPCRNEEDFILRCLDSVFASDYPAELIEVIVCDGKSDDNTSALVRNYAEKNQRVQFLVNEKMTTPFALNMGIKNASGDVIVILGAHAEIAINYISESVKILEAEPTVACVGGVLKNSSDDELTAAVSLAMSSPFGVGSAHFRTGAKDGFVDTVAFGAYRKEVFSQVGLFDEELARNQDDEFNFRLIKSGFKIRLTTATSAKYYVRSSFGKLFKQYFQYGYWKVYVNKKHKTVTTLRQLVPVFFVACGFALFIFVLSFPYRWEYFALYYVFYFSAASFFALPLAIRNSHGPKTIKTFFAVLLSFFILHVSYGMGYMEGLWDFIITGKNNSSGKTTLTR